MRADISRVKRITAIERVQDHDEFGEEVGLQALKVPHVRLADDYIPEFAFHTDTEQRSFTSKPGLSREG